MAKRRTLPSSSNKKDKMENYDQPDHVRRLDALRRRFGGSLRKPDDFQVNRHSRRAEAAEERKSKHLQPKWMDTAHARNLTEDEKKHLPELNEHYATGLLGSSFRIIFEPGNGKPAKFLSAADAALRESARLIWMEGSTKGSLKKIKAFKHWLEWDGHRAYDEIKFAPGNDDPLIYNLFRGFPIEPREGDWSILHSHILNVICAGKLDQYAWFMTWLAHIFQCPGEKGSVAVVIRGEKGTGKSIVFDFVHKLMPSYFFKEANGKRVVGNFNAQYEHTLLLLMEEAFWAGDQANESTLKDLITSPLIPIERKGVDKYMAENFMRVAMISNEKWVVPASGRERRFAVLDATNAHINDIEYFGNMKSQMGNGGLEAMLYDLLNWKPENGWNILRTPPASSGLREQVVESLRGLDRFMYELLSNGIYECEKCADGAITLNEDETTEHSMTDIRIAAQDYLADHFTGQKAATFDMIQPRVVEWFGAIVERKKGKMNNGRWVAFPPLSECREHVLRTKGIKITGSDDGSPHDSSSTLH
ncbi:DUF5906 domain-containing protein [Sphingomonas sp. PB2P19]|uniref:primase-helicase family protein n=1 Tax=Sphingomonas rhamnosi TaxID=3096156 RepID=UPI002FC5B45E